MYYFSYISMVQHTSNYLKLYVEARLRDPGFQKP